MEVERIEVVVRAGGTVRARAEAAFSIPEPAAFASTEIEMRLGEAIQMIPAGAFVETEDGYLYSDPAGEAGFFRRVEYRVVEERLLVEGRTAASGWAAPRTRARVGVVLSVESTAFQAAQSVKASRKANRLVYRAN